MKLTFNDRCGQTLFKCYHKLVIHFLLRLVHNRYAKMSLGKIPEG